MKENGLLANQYDRMLRALERRLAAGDVPRSQGMRERIKRAIRKVLSPAADVALENHVALLRLSRDSESRIRILTTNFDTLFERAWHSVNLPDLRSYACQEMPRPRTATFGGVLHLHGRLADTSIGVGETELVLTSAEFGDAYLRSGWASRYVYDLARTHILVLVGYSADDPPMRYLLETLEADRERYPDLKRVFAFADVKVGQESAHDALWRAKGIEPILYHVKDGDGHAQLYRTLNAWSDYAQDPTAWRRERLRLLMTEKPENASPADHVEISSLLSHGDAEHILQELMPAAAWLPVLRKTGTFDGKRTSPGPWIAQRIDDVEMIRECAAAPPTDMHSLRCIERAVEVGATKLSGELRKAWNVIQRAISVRHVDITPPWYQVRTRVISGDIDHGVLTAVAASFKPRLHVRRSYDRSASEKPVENAALKFSDLVRTQFKPIADGLDFHEILAAWPEQTETESRLLKVLNRELEDALEESRETEGPARDEQASLDVPFLPDPRSNMFGSGFSPIVHLITALWTRLADKSTSEARLSALAWRNSSFLISRRLYLNALLRADAFESTEIRDTLLELDDRIFWVSDARHEIALLLASRWNSLDETHRTAIADRIRKGVPRDLFSAGDFGGGGYLETVPDRLVFVLLSRIKSAGGTLDVASLDLLKAHGEKNPEWTHSFDELSNSSHPYVFKSGPQGEVGVLKSVPDNELVREALRLQQEPASEQRDVWKLLCSADPERGLRAVAFEADADRWELPVLDGLLGAAYNVESHEFQVVLAQTLLRAPDSFMDSIGRSVMSWMLQCCSKLIAETVPSVHLLNLWDRLAERTYDQPDDSKRTGLDGDDLEGASLNEPGGILSWILCNILDETNPSIGAGLGHMLLPRFDRIARAEGRSGLLARVYLARNLAYLYAVDATWIEKQMLSRFRPEHPESLPLWEGRLRGPVPNAPALFNEMKPYFFAMLNGAMSFNRAQQLAEHLLLPAVWKRQEGGADFDIAPSDVRRALAAGCPELRHAAAFMFFNWMKNARTREKEDPSDAWRTTIGPLFREVWPIDAVCRDSRTSQYLVRMLLECKEAFPEALGDVVDLLVPFEMYSIESMFFGGLDMEAVIRRSPEGFLRLLDAVVAPRPTGVARDLASVLKKISIANSAVESSSLYLRLSSLARQRDA
ncbi:SIR2 family protein [Myxococcus llanfairpwllgwyngyllgogerychwyrndrobwllllantysiliogogogochensis]|nr:SIR2 family protein [Myxococcus llanfairpwllgwyngyllgogerychwyrndrobwllllantysiliogogogochensis]